LTSVGRISVCAAEVARPGKRGLARVDGCVDAAYPDVRLSLEADGPRWHTRIRDLRLDHERDAQAARVGWQTLRFLYEQISESASDVVATVVDVRRVRAQQLGRRAG
jgi:very-short-patch-repair endonuclease